MHIIKNHSFEYHATISEMANVSSFSPPLLIKIIIPINISMMSCVQAAGRHSHELSLLLAEVLLLRGALLRS